MAIPAEYQFRQNPWTVGRAVVPMISVSSGSIGNNGALTAITALPRTYANCYLYLPASAISAGSAAGWYFAQMSSTTAGTIFNNTYTTGDPTIPASPIAFVTTGPGAFVGDTTEQGVTFTVPANSMGKSGILKPWAGISFTNSGNNKTIRVRFSGAAGTVFFSGVPTTSVTYPIHNLIANQGATNSQLAIPQATAGSWATTNTLNYTTASVDTTADTTLLVTIQKANAADNLTLEMALLELLYGA